MKKNKLMLEYDNKYGDLPNTQSSMIEYLLDKLQKSSKKKKKTEKSIIHEMNRIRKIKWKSYKFTIFLIPKATPRARLGMNNIFYVAGASDNKRMFREFMKDHPHDTITTPMKYNINVYLPTPASLKIEDRILAEYGFIRPLSKPDFDNVAKTYADMIQGNLIIDDALIIESHIAKYYSIKPRIEISIEYMEEHDSDFNKDKIDKKIMKGNI